MKGTSRIIVGTLLALLPALALACGACIEDKVAATYDHAVVSKAAAKGERVVFGEIEGSIDPKRVGKAIREQATKIRGVQRGSVHTSVAPPAFSFALDPRVQTPEHAARELESLLAMQGVRLSVIRVQ